MRTAVVAVMIALGAPAFAADAPPSPESLRAAAQALLKEWAEAQHRGDAQAYLALYDQRNFKGQKRTTSGERKQYNYAGWASDRSKMLKNKPEVAVENVSMETWRDPRSKMRPGLVHVRFLQRWRSPRYADHGPKIMQLYYGPDGKLRIIYEALLQSRPGWEPSAGVAKSLPVPRSEDEAIALWDRLAVVGKNWEEAVGSIGGVPQLRRMMARALLARGDLACKQIVDEGQCGEEDFEWGPLPDDATLADPCLRRKVAVWALENGGLTAADLRALWPRLEAVFAFDTPWKKSSERTQHQGDGDELCTAVLDAAGTVEELTVAAIDASVRGDCAADHARKRVASLSPKGRLALAEKQSVEEAFDRLDAKAHSKLFLAAIGNSALKSSFRVDAMKRLADALPTSAALKEALRTIADQDGDLEVSALAGVTLAGLGDASRLPKRPATDTPTALERELGRLRHDPDENRREERFRAFLPKRGKFVTTTTIDREYDGNTPPDERNEHEEQVDKTNVDQAAFSFLDSYFTPGSGEKVSLQWKTIANKLYLVGVSIERREFHGCPC